MASSRWIILIEWDDGDVEAIGTVDASDAASAIATARAEWFGVSPDWILGARLWDGAGTALRDDAIAEDSKRLELLDLEVQPVVALAMMGMTAAITVDFPQLVDSLQRFSISPLAKTKLFLSYVAFLSYWTEREARSLVDGVYLARFLNLLRSEVSRAFLSMIQGDSPDRSDFRDATEQLFGAFQVALDDARTDNTSEDRSVFGAVGVQAAMILGLSGENEIIGPVMIQAESTARRLGVDSFFAPLSRHS